jgi:Dcp1-like decapping family
LQLPLVVFLVSLTISKLNFQSGSRCLLLSHYKFSRAIFHNILLKNLNRSSGPKYGFLILNRLDYESNLIEKITGNLEVKDDGTPFLIFHSTKSLYLVIILIVIIVIMVLILVSIIF